MVQAAIEGQLDNATFLPHSVFGILMPTSCPNVPDEILNPKDTWADKDAYDNQANRLAQLFINNFEEYKAKASAEIISASPRIQEVKI